MRRVLVVIAAALTASLLVVPAPAYSAGTVTGVVVDEDGRPIDSLDVYGLPRSSSTNRAT